MKKIKIKNRIYYINDKSDFLLIICVGIPILAALVISLIFLNFNDLTTLFVSIAFLLGLLVYKILNRKSKNEVSLESKNSNKLKQKIYNILLLIILVIIIITLIWGKLSLS